MAGVDFTLGANTQGFISGLKGARAEANKSFKAIEDRANKFGNTLDKSLKGADKAVQSLSAAIGAGGLGMAFSAVGVGAAMAMNKIIDLGNASIESKKKMDELAAAAGVTADRYQELSVVAMAMGSDFDSAMSEAGKSIESFVSSGSGLSEYMDMIQGKVNRSRSDFAKLGAMDALKLINEDLDKVGASTDQKIKAFNQLGANVADLQPLLGMTNDAVKTTFNNIAAHQINISKETEKSINLMNNNMQTFSTNFRTYIVESFKDTFKWITRISKAMAEMAEEGALNNRAKRYAGAITSGDKEAQAEMQAEMAEDPTYFEMAVKPRMKQYSGGGSTGNLSASRRGMMGNYQAAERGGVTDKQAADEIIDFNKKVDDMVEAAKKEYSSKQQIAGISPEETKAKEDFYKKQLEIQLKYSNDERKSAEIAYNLALHELRNKENEKYLTKEEFAEAELKLAQEKQQKLEDIDKREIEAAKKLRDELHKMDMQKLADVQAFATDKKVINDMQLAQEAAALEQRFAEANKDGEVVSEEQKLNKIAELRREHKARELEIELADVADADARRLMQAEKELEYLREQRELGLITQKEFDERELESERNVSEARTQLVMKRLNEMSSLFSGMSQMLEKGSKEQKAVFAMEKAASIAQMTINGYKAWTDVDKDPSLVTQYQKIAAKAMVAAQYGSQIAAAGAVVVKGQAHDGMTNLPSTGSYILEQGERVVSKGQNSDLTEYLKSNEKGSGQTTVNADLVIQGDASGLDENKFNEYLIKHRESVTRAVSLAKSENPGL